MRSVLFGTIILGLLGSQRAWAEAANPVPHAKDLFRAGATAYGAGDYLAAIQALEGAYALTPLPAIAFSLAQAQRRQYFVAHDRQHLKRAIDLYRKYVEQSPNGARRADALEAMSQLEPLLSERGIAVSGALQQESRNGAPTRVMITVDDPGARVSLDGGPPFSSPVIREVKPGTHRVDLAADGYYPSHREVLAVEGELIPVDVALVKRPSTVAFWTSRSAEILVDGAFASIGGDAIVLQIPSGPHEVAVLQKGHRTWSRHFSLKPGEVISARATLELTTQRYASRAMFVAGGAALGSGLIFGALALRAENSSQAFLARQSNHNVSAEELSQYDNSLHSRNRWRAASILSLASAGGLFVAGSLLHELDNPTGRDRYPSEPRHPGPNSNPSESDQASWIRVRPEFAGTIGLTLDAAF